MENMLMALLNIHSMRIFKKRNISLITNHSLVDMWMKYWVSPLFIN